MLIYKLKKDSSTECSAKTFKFAGFLQLHPKPVCCSLLALQFGIA